MKNFDEWQDAIKWVERAHRLVDNAKSEPAFFAANQELQNAHANLGRIAESINPRDENAAQINWQSLQFLWERLNVADQTGAVLRIDDLLDIERRRRVDADLLAHKLLGEHCACYAEAWESPTCDAVKSEAANTVRRFLRKCPPSRKWTPIWRQIKWTWPRPMSWFFFTLAAFSFSQGAIILFTLALVFAILFWS